jgi:multidrug efflux pump
METGEYERIVSFSRPGESQVTFIARDSMHSKEIPDLWYQVRKKVSDIRQTLPPGSRGRSSTMNSAPPSAISTR